MSEAKRKIKQGSALRTILFSVLIGIIVLTVMLFIFALIVANSNLDLDNIKYFCLLAMLIAGFIASAISAYKNRQLKGLIIGLLTSATLSFLFLLIVIIINGGAVSTFTLILTVFSVLTGLPGGIIGANLKQ